VFKQVHKLLLSLALLWALAPPSTQAQIINYPSGFAGSSGQIWLEANASLSGSTIQLVSLNVHSANNAWYKTPVNIQAFTTTFTWTIACPSSGSGLACGDGFGFMMICACSPGNPVYSPPGKPGFTYSGWSGGQFSWSTCLAPWQVGNGCPAINAILVKFDLYDIRSSTEGNLTGYYTGGEWPQPPNPEYDMAPSGIRMQSGHLMSSTLTYDGATLSQMVIDTVTHAVFTKHYTANIPAAIGGDTAFVGFGGGTGAAQFQGNIHTWTYTVKSPARIGSGG
jgi:hypothetical protein